MKAHLPGGPVGAEEFDHVGATLLDDADVGDHDDKDDQYDDDQSDKESGHDIYLLKQNYELAVMCFWVRRSA